MYGFYKNVFAISHFQLSSLALSPLLDDTLIQLPSFLFALSRTDLRGKEKSAQVSKTNLWMHWCASKGTWPANIQWFCQKCHKYKWCALSDTFTWTLHCIPVDLRSMTVQFCHDLYEYPFDGWLLLSWSKQPKIISFLEYS